MRLRGYGKKDERHWVVIARALANASNVTWLVWYDGKVYHLTSFQARMLSIDRSRWIALCVPNNPQRNPWTEFKEDVG